MSAASAALHRQQQQQQQQQSIPQDLLDDPILYLTRLESSIANNNDDNLPYLALSHLVVIVAPIILQCMDHRQQTQQQRVMLAQTFLNTTASILMLQHNVAGMQEMQRIQHFNQLAKIVGHAAAVLGTSGSRNAIVQSGIIPAMAQVLINVGPDPTREMSILSVEFLQCCLLAEHYRYAARIVESNWPRPSNYGMKYLTGGAGSNSAAVPLMATLTLRYYYYRGLIHLGCNDYAAAHSCLWTCLSIPADTVSSLQVAAWKKLILVQCLQHVPSDGKQGSSSKSPTVDGAFDQSVSSAPRKSSSITRLPPGVASCFTRMLTSRRDGTRSGSGSNNNNNFYEQPPQRDGPSESVPIYFEIAKAFAKQDYKQLSRLEVMHRSALGDDQNTGLLRQVQTKCLHWKVFHLASIYAVVPMDTLRQSLEKEMKAGAEMDTGTAAAAMTNDAVLALLCQSGVAFECQDGGFVAFPKPLPKNIHKKSISLAQLVKLVEFADHKMAVSG